MGGYIEYKEAGKNPVNAGVFEARQTRIAALIGHRDGINIRARELGNPLGAIDKVQTYTRSQAKAKEQAFRIKLNREEEKRVIVAIKAKQASLEHGVKKQMGIRDEEQALTTQQIQIEVKQVAQEVPPAVALGPTMALVVWILKKLPDRIYKFSTAAVILSMALSACSAIDRSDTDVGQFDPTATETSFMPDVANQETVEFEQIPTAIPTETVVALSAVDELLTRYEAGESIDVSHLSSTEFVEFSAKLAEKKNTDRGVNPIIYNNEKYIDPEDLKVKDYDGHPDMNETIQMYVPIAGKDGQGNLQFDSNGELITIPGSANVDWNMQISDPYDTRIDWPKTEPMPETGISEVQSKLDIFKMVLSPMIFLGKQVGELKLDSNVGTFDTLSTLAFYDIETDAVGNPVLARMILTIGVNYNLFEEGGTLDAQAFMGQVPENSYVYQGLQANAVYYVGISPRQTEDFEQSRIFFDGNQGIVAGNKSLEVITGQETNDKDMVLANANLLIRKTTNTTNTTK